MTASTPGLPPQDHPPATRGLRAGQKVGGGRFALVETLGEGGMGIVWKAADSTLGGMVALKFLPLEISSDPTAIEDLRRETSQTRRLSHPNIVRVYDLYEDVSPFIYMEFVEGHTLSHERVRHPRHVLPWSYLAPYVAQLCDGLDYAHQERVIHRDLKPTNILLNHQRNLIKLVDFGIARAVKESVTRVTQKRLPDGTLVYMSCQQLNGEPPTAIDDIYSLGVTLYELLSSKPPFHSGDTAWQIRYGEIPPLTDRLAEFELENEVPHHVEEAILACLARDPFKRPQSARDVSVLLGLAEPRIPTSGRFRAPAGTQPSSATGSAEAPGAATRAVDYPGRSPITTTPLPSARRADLPPASLPEPAPLPRPRRAARAVFWLLLLGAVAATLYYLQVSADILGPTTRLAGRSQVRLYEALQARFQDWRAALANPDVSPTPVKAGGAPTTQVARTDTTVQSPNPETTLATSNANVAPETARIPLAPPSSPTTLSTNASPPPIAPALTPATNPATPPVTLTARHTSDLGRYPAPERPWTNSLGMRFVPVPTLRPLFAVWETRRSDYDAFIQSAKSHRAYTLRPPPFQQSHPQEPVVKVSWSNAVAFCRWLTDAEHEKGSLAPTHSYRLPTDQEWSAAVGLTNEAGRTLAERIAGSRFSEQYPWDGPWPPPKGAGNFRGTETRFPTAIPRYDDGAQFTSIVGRYGTNRVGVADLSGNVWEWCLQEPGEPLRVARGGAWDTSDPRELRSGHRYLLTPGTELESLGFRCVLDAGEE